jgi:hypothetical protein
MALKTVRAGKVRHSRWLLNRSKPPWCSFQLSDKERPHGTGQESLKCHVPEARRCYSPASSS